MPIASIALSPSKKGSAASKPWASALLLATLTSALSLPAQVQTLATGNNSGADGYLAIRTDAYGSWAWQNNPPDLYNPAGPLGTQNIGFSSGCFIFLPLRPQRELLSADVNWQALVGNDGSLTTAVLGTPVVSDTDSDGVNDRMVSAFRITGSINGFTTDFHVDLDQHVVRLGGGAAQVRLRYTVRNDSPAVAPINFVRHYDNDHFFSGSINDDEVGTDTSQRANYASAFSQEPGNPATRVRIATFGTGNVSYYGMKAGVGGPPTPLAGSTPDIYNNYGLPGSWRNYVANIGTAVDGTSLASPGNDASCGVAFNSLVLAGQSILVPFDITYGDPAASRIVFDAAPAATVKETQPWPAFSIRLEDAAGNLIVNDDQPVTVALASGTGILGGTTTKTSVGGRVTFDDITYDRAESIAIVVQSGALANAAAALIVKPFISDLRIQSSDITLNPIAPAAGQSTTITARVRNVGTDPTSATVRFYLGNPDLGGTLINTQSASIPVGGNVAFGTNWVPQNDGPQRIYAVVTNNSATDATPADNRANTQVVVGAAALDLRIVAGEWIAWPGATATVPVTISNFGFSAATLDALSFGPPSWLALESDVIGRTLQPGENVVAQTTLSVPLGTVGGPLNGSPILYPVPITATSGGNTFGGPLKVKVFDQAATQVTVRVTDANTTLPIGGALVSAQDLVQTVQTNGAGEALLNLPPGSRGLFAFKNGYIATAVNADIPDGASTVEIALAPGATLAVSTVVSEPLSTQEIIDRGVTVNDPVNNTIFDFVVGLKIGEPLVITNIELPINPTPGTTDVFSGVATGGSIGGGGIGGGGYVVAACFHYNQYGRTETWIVIPGEVWVLKQFFEATVFVVNNAVAPNPADVQLQNIESSLNVPSGIGLPDLDGAPQDNPQLLGTLDAGESTQATWVIRGDVAGSYSLDGLVSADLVAFGGTPIPLVATAASDPFIVSTPQVSCDFVTPAAVTANQPFDFDVVITNEGDATANLVRVLLKEENLVGCTLVGTELLQPAGTTLTFDANNQVVSATAVIGDLEPAQGGIGEFVLISELTGTVLREVIANGCGINPTPNVEVVSDPPSIVTDPQSQFVCEGNAVTFTVVADGGTPLDYQWRKDGVAIGSATATSYTIDPVTTADAGAYDVVVSNLSGSVTSAAAILTVGVMPSITADPTDTTVCQDDPVTFSVIADGNPAPTYQWRRDGSAIAGATGASYSIANAATADEGAYDCVVTNVCGAVTSAAATLTVELPPTITADPQGGHYNEGDPVQLSVVADGTAPFSYQWLVGGTAIAGATNSTYGIAAAAFADAGDYTVVVTNSCGAVTSAVATVDVNRLPVIQCVGPITLWSPDHELVDVSSVFSVTDPDSDPTTVTIRVFSDETEVPDTGDGTGRHAPDFKNELGGRGLLVRSERRGSEDGRWYVGVITADDGQGGVVEHACALAVCPQSQSSTAESGVLAQATQAAAAIQAAVDADSPLPIAGTEEHGLSGQLGPKQ